MFLESYVEISTGSSLTKVRKVESGDQNSQRDIICVRGYVCLYGVKIRILFIIQMVKFLV